MEQELPHRIEELGIDFFDSSYNFLYTTLYVGN